MSRAESFAAFLVDALNNDEARAPELPVEGVIARLRDDCAQLDTRRRFKKGDLVQYAPNVNFTRLSGPFVFRRWLLLPGPRVAELYPARYDCIIAIFEPRAGVTMETLAVSNRLAPFEGKGRKADGAQVAGMIANDGAEG